MIFVLLSQIRKSWFSFHDSLIVYYGTVRTIKLTAYNKNINSVFREVIGCSTYVTPFTRCPLFLCVNNSILDALLNNKGVTRTQGKRSHYTRGTVLPKRGQILKWSSEDNNVSGSPRAHIFLCVYILLSRSCWALLCYWFVFDFVI